MGTEKLSATFRNPSSKALGKAKVVWDYLDCQGTEVKVGNRHMANSCHCFSLQSLRRVQLPRNFTLSVSSKLNG